MSSSPAPSDDARSATAMPTAARVAVITMSALAALLLLYSALIWFRRDRIIDDLVQDGSIAREDGTRFLITQLSPFVVLGLLLAASAGFLARRQPWARWLGLAGTVVIALLTLVSVFIGGALSILSLLLAVLSMAAISSLLSRTTKVWLSRLRGSY